MDNKITAEQLTLIYEFSNDIKIPLSETIKFVESYLNKKSERAVSYAKRFEKGANTYANNIITKLDRKGDFEETEDLDIPKTILESYNEYKNNH